MICTLVVSSSLCALVAGCAADASSSDSPGTASTPTVLASVDKGNGHVIEFLQLVSGELVVSEQAPLSTPPILSDRRGMTASELYRIVQPDGPVPRAIVDADARAAEQLKAPRTKIAPPPKDLEPVDGSRKTFYTAGQQTWFKSTFCANNSQTANLQACIQGFSFVNAGWNYGEQYSFVYLNGSEGQTGTVTGYNWNGSAQLVYSKALPPGTYVSTSWPVQAPSWHWTELDGVGNDTLVSGAVSNCGEGNQWSCTLWCGSCDPEQTVGCEIVDGNGHGICEQY
jgi:hypothetical protein